MLKGKKTYGVGVIMVGYAILGWLLGDMPDAKAGEVLLEGIGLITLRAGIAKGPSS